MDVDDLYGLQLDRFVAERAALAKALRKAGSRDEAAEVAGLRKPSVAAWAVNQLIRTQRSATQELLDAGDALRDAQSDLLAGSGDGRALRAAGERERAAVDALVETARGLLSSEGLELSATVVERVSDTLHAAALDDQAREQVRHGRLERELRHVGLGLGLGGDAAASSPRHRPATSPRSPSAPARPSSAGGSKSSAGARAERERAAERRADAERVRRERAAARRDARAAHATARRRADAATRALDAAVERREQAALELRESDEALTAARKDADVAAEALRRAEADLAAAEEGRL